MDSIYGNDTQDYGDYLIGEGQELDDVSQRFNAVDRAIQGIQIFTTHERDLSTFRTLQELQEWVSSACDLSQVKPKVSLLRGDIASAAYEEFVGRGKESGVPVFHFVALDGREVHLHPIDKGLWHEDMSVEEWFSATEMSESHGWQVPKLRLDFSASHGDYLRESYMTAQGSLLAPHLETGEDGPTQIEEHDLVVISFDGQFQVLALPRIDTMVNVHVKDDGFQAAITAHYAPPRKRYLEEFRKHRKTWATWYASNADISSEELEAGAVKVETLVAEKLAKESEAGR